VHRPYAAGDAEGFLLVIAATNDGAVNDGVWAECRAQGTFCVVVDDRTRGDAAFAAISDHGPVRIAVSTGGHAPALAQWVRDRVASVMPENLGDVAYTLDEERAAVRAATGTSEGYDWRRRIEALVDPSGEEASADRDDAGRSGGAVTC
jgi:uroporphyrin-III C-methyltransferase/precorrin-2 dehydrogenase/sirohydrochlorin ferrochelatase